MLKRLADKFKKFQKRKQTIRELERLTNRELSDLGICRYDIRHLDI
ncbi:DUF1127 domain-containing protein [Rhizobium phage RHph_I1_18]|nr:DUF1127 domain-containing protein [Rhizobium phage RHph_I1_18]